MQVFLPFFPATMHLGALWSCCIILLVLILNFEFGASHIDETQPLSKIALHRMRLAEDSSVSIDASPTLLGSKVKEY
jgi:hypothetical protein